MSHDKATLDALRIDRRQSSAPSGGRGVLWVLLGLFLLLVGLGAFWKWGLTKSMVVRTVAAREETVGGQRTLLNASGYVTARREATISSKITGKVIEVLVEEGRRVESGQVLARIDATNVEASLRLAEAQARSVRAALLETEVRVDEAQREFRRVTELAAGGVATQADLERADASLKSLRARLERQRADVGVSDGEVAVWKQQLEDTVVRAPFSGIVTSKNAQPGEMISPVSAGGGFTRTGICTIVDMASLEIEVDVNESYINRVVPEQRVEAVLDAYPDWRIPARVIAIIPTADRQKATVKVRVGFEQTDGRILPQMGVKVAFQSGTGTSGEGAAPVRAVVIPKVAVRAEGGKDVVWLLREGRLERRAVSVRGAATGDEVVVQAGVAGGDRVIVEGFNGLTERSRVTEATR